MLFFPEEICYKGLKAQHVEEPIIGNGMLIKFSLRHWSTYDKGRLEALGKPQWIEIYDGNFGLGIYGLWYNKCMTPSVA